MRRVQKLERFQQIPENIKTITQKLNTSQKQSSRKVATSIKCRQSGKHKQD